MTGKSLPALMIDAIKANDIRSIHSLFEAHPESKTYFTPFAGGTWLHYAAGRGQLEIVKLLLSLGMDVNGLDRQGERTALVDAASFGWVEVVQHLLDQGAVMDTGASISNPLLACIAGYRGAADEPRERFATIARLFIDRGINLTACYNQQTMVDMDASAFAYEWGRRDIAAMVIEALYGHDERLSASAWAEAIEVAVGNASRQKFRKWRYPSERDKAVGNTSPPGEHWN